MGGHVDHDLRGSRQCHSEGQVTSGHALTSPGPGTAASGHRHRSLTTTCDLLQPSPAPRRRVNCSSSRPQLKSVVRTPGVERGS